MEQWLTDSIASLLIVLALTDRGLHIRFFLGYGVRYCICILCFYWQSAAGALRQWPTAIFHPLTPKP